MRAVLFQLFNWRFVHSILKFKMLLLFFVMIPVCLKIVKYTEFCTFNDNVYYVNMLPISYYVSICLCLFVQIFWIEWFILSHIFEHKAFIASRRVLLELADTECHCLFEFNNYADFFSLFNKSLISQSIWSARTKIKQIELTPVGKDNLLKP